MTKLTEWFPPEIKPVYKGIYQRGAPFSTEVFSYWNGRYWSFFEYYSDRNFVGKSAEQNCLWRGLANDPKKGKNNGMRNPILQTRK